MNQNELYHHGVLGQKWGVRRYQNEDGSYKSGVKGRYNEKIIKTAENRLSRNEKKANRKVEKAMKSVESINKDIASYEQIKNGAYTKSGQVVLSKKDVADIVRGLNEVKLNTITKTDKYEKGLEESRKIMNELSNQYYISYDVSTNKYHLKNK